MTKGKGVGVEEKEEKEEKEQDFPSFYTGDHSTVKNKYNTEETKMKLAKTITFHLHTKFQV